MQERGRLEAAVLALRTKIKESQALYDLSVIKLKTVRDPVRDKGGWVEVLFACQLMVFPRTKLAGTGLCT